MALQDILDSIVSDADRRIAEASSEHKKRMKAMREESERTIVRSRMNITEQCEQKKRQLKEKAESHARMVRSKMILGKKQEYMTALYADVLQKLTELPKEKAEAFLQKCLEQVDGKGTIYPAKAHEALLKKHLPAGCELGRIINAAGGFRFVSDKKEYDFTFEFLVHDVLHPRTEMEIAHMLFPSSR